MSTVGSFVKDPGIVRLPWNGVTQILRGQLVGFTIATAPAIGTAIPINAAAGAAQTGKIYGVALSDADPDLGSVAIAVKGGYTVPMQPVSGQTFNQGTVVAQGATPNFSQVVAGPTAGLNLGWAVTGLPDAQGNIEVACFWEPQA